jgi:hypothetical protein
MSTIILRDIWDTDIITSGNFDKLLEELLPGKPSFLQPVKVKLGAHDPPIFLYQESREKKNFVTSFEYYGGRGTRVQTRFGARQDLQISKYFGAAERGEVLDFFCRFEFCLDVLMCVAVGVFDDKISYQRLESQFLDEGGSFSTTDRKINYLKDFRLLSPRTVRYLKKAKRIRNILGHQYLPQDLGVSPEEIAEQGGPTEAIGAIYTATWFYLLNDFVKHQDHVARWLVQKISN